MSVYSCTRWCKWFCGLWPHTPLWSRARNRHWCANANAKVADKFALVEGEQTQSFQLPRCDRKHILFEVSLFQVPPSHPFRISGELPSLDIMVSLPSVVFMLKWMRNQCGGTFSLQHACIIEVFAGFLAVVFQKKVRIEGGTSLSSHLQAPTG